jgi:hypothetical protein
MLTELTNQARALPAGKEFHLSELCPGAEWEALTSGERKILGKRFRGAVEASTPPIARHVGRTSNNQAIYRRI